MSSRTSFVVVSFAFAITAFASGCAPRQAVLPPVAQARATGHEQALFQNFHLDEEKGVWGSKWKRSDGVYAYPELDQVFDAYPETREKKHSAAVRGGIVGGLAGAGGALAGFVAGYNLAVPARERWSGPTIGGTLGAAGGLLAMAIVIAVATDNPLDTIGTTYNDALKRDLAQPLPPMTPPSLPSSAIEGKERPTGMGIGWGVRF